MELIKFIRFSIFALAALTFVACEDDDDDDDPPQNNNEEELITDLNVSFVNQATDDTVTFSFSDPDGPGGNPPSIDDIKLEAGIDYDVFITVADASNPDDVEDITQEIEEEDDEHQFFFIRENGAENVVQISYDPNDVDDDGNPIGLFSLWETLQPTSGGEQVRIVLRHLPDKDGAGVADGDISNAGGETDIDVTFNLTINN